MSDDVALSIVQFMKFMILHAQLHYSTIVQLAYSIIVQFVQYTLSVYLYLACNSCVLCDRICLDSHLDSPSQTNIGYVFNTITKHFLINRQII